MRYILLATALTACAGQAPLELQHIKRTVDARAGYAYYTGWDNRVLASGDRGNCAAFAYTYQHEALKQDLPLIIASCTLRDGQEHAFARTVDGWALDVRQREVVRLKAIGCR